MARRVTTVRPLQRTTAAAGEQQYVMSHEDAQRRSVIKLDVSNVGSVRELHELLAETLGFPGFYGKNWDAFWDSITGLVQMPRRLVIIGWPNVVSHWSKDAQIMLDCLRDLNEQYPTRSCNVELYSTAPDAAT
jgi:RNAse (barnase) inhibitor barstar